MTNDFTLNQQDQGIQGSQTNIGGSVHGLVISGQFHGPVHIGETVSSHQIPAEKTKDSTGRSDVVILTVLPEEYDAICNKLQNLSRWPGDKESNNIYAWQMGIVPSSTNPSTAYSVVVGMIGRAGTKKSTAATIEAIHLWKPRYFFFVGVAGGLSDLTKGDVIIADIIHGYEYGKIDDKGFLPRDNWTFPTDGGLFTGAIAYALRTDWHRLIKLTPPIVCNSNTITGEVASGDKVVDDPTDSFFNKVLLAYPKVKAVEMEGAGAGEAIEQAHAHGKAIGFMMIRGISDLPRQMEDNDEKRGTQERDDWKPYAADAAAAFAIGYIASGLPIPPSRGSSQSDTLTSPCPKLFNIPELPPNYLRRQDDIKQIKDRLFSDTKTTGITGSLSKLGVQGMGGIGKSVIAAAVAHDQEIQRAFPDGIFWITIGSAPNLMLRQSDLAFALDDVPRVFNDIEQGRSQLSKLLAGKTCLLILDDVWDVEDAGAFNSLGPRSKMLITTRDAAVINGLGAKPYSLDLLSRDEALKLLADWAEMLPDSMPIDADDIVDECGYLPLAVAMIGAMLKGKPLDRWKNALNKFRSSDLDNIAYKFPKYPYPSLLKAIQVSIDALSGWQQARYLDFAVFPEDTPIPEEVLHTFWADDLDHGEIQDFVDLLVERSLVRRDKNQKLNLHDLQFDFVRKQTDNLQSLHIRLLDSYHKKCPDGWPTGPNDGYFFQHVISHLKEAGKDEELESLLLNFKWIRCKLEKTNINSLLTDYVFSLNNEDLQIVAKALKLSSPALAIDKNQLPCQLYGRLMAQDSPLIKAMLVQVKPRRGEPWLYPLTPSLKHPGEPLFGTLGRHKSMVISVDIARYDQHDIVVSCSADQTLKVWDLGTGQLLKTLEGHTSRVNAVALTHDGRRAISASADGIIKIWNIRNGQPLKTLIGSKGLISNFRSIALTRDDNWLISASEDKLLRIWDLNTSKILKTLSGHTDLVSKVVLTQDDKRAISASYDNTIKIWDLETGSVLKTLEGHNGRINALAITSDDKFAVSGSKDKTLKIWDLETGLLLKTLEGHNNRILSLALTHDDKRIVSTSADMTLKVWDLITGRIINTLRGHSDKVNGIAITPDDRFAVSASADSTLNIWDLRAIEHPKILTGHSRSINSIIATTDGYRAVSASNDETIKIWDLETGHLLKTLNDQRAKFNAIALTSDNRYLIAASSDRRLRIWDFNSGDLLRTLKKHEHQVNQVVLTPDNQRAISASIDRTIKVWNFADGKILHSLEGHSEVINSLALTADGRRAISASNDKTIRIWDLENGKLLKTLEGHTDNINAVILTSNDQRAISASSDRILRIWDTENGTSLNALEGHTDKINAITITHDDQLVISASADKTLRIWNLQTGHLQKTLIGHAGWVNAVALMSNDRFAVSASNDKTLKIWDIQTGRSIVTFTADGPINTLAISPDGSKIIAGDTVGIVHILCFENYG